MFLVLAAILGFKVQLESKLRGHGTADLNHGRLGWLIALRAVFDDILDATLRPFTHCVEQGRLCVVVGQVQRHGCIARRHDALLNPALHLLPLASRGGWERAYRRGRLNGPGLIFDQPGQGLKVNGLEFFLARSCPLHFPSLDQVSHLEADLTKSDVEILVLSGYRDHAAGLSFSESIERLAAKFPGVLSGHPPVGHAHVR